MRAKGRLMTMQAMTGKTEGRHSTLDEVLAMETGAQATVHGLVHTLRDLGDVRFALLRMPQGVLQCVLGAGEDARQPLSSLTRINRMRLGDCVGAPAREQYTPKRRAMSNSYKK